MKTVQIEIISSLLLITEIQNCENRKTHFFILLTTVKVGGLGLMVSALGSLSSDPG